MSARSKRTTRRRSLAADSEPAAPPIEAKKLPTLCEAEECPPVTPTPANAVESTSIASKTGVFTRIKLFFSSIWTAILSFIIMVVTLPLMPLKHLPSKSYVKRSEVEKVAEMKKELRVLERELAKAKRRNSIVAAERPVIMAAAPAPAALPPPPPPPKLALPPPPPPPPVAGLKAPIKAYRTSTASEGGAPTSKARVKPAGAKKGFDISAAQIASIAGRLRKTSEGAPSSNSSVSDPSNKKKSPQRADLGATLRANMKTRRSSLLQLEVDSENRRPTSSEENKSPSSKNQTQFKLQLRKAPISRSPGGTPLRTPVPSTPPIAFNTALADKNVTITPPRPIDAPVF